MAPQQPPAWFQSKMLGATLAVVTGLSAVAATVGMILANDYRDEIKASAKAIVDIGQVVTSHTERLSAQANLAAERHAQHEARIVRLEGWAFTRRSSADPEPPAGARMNMNP